MEQFYPVIAQCPLFDMVNRDEYQNLMTCINANIRKYNSDDYVILAGSQIAFVGIVLSGAVEIIKENPAGARLIMDVLGPGHIFGEGIVCTKARIAPVSVRVKAASQILVIPFERIIKTCGKSCDFHFQLIQNMMMLLGEKNFRMNVKIELLMLKGMREKLATYLLEQASQNNNRSFDIFLNRNELAEYLNVSRTSMSRELSRMKDEGLLDYYQNSFRILDREGLTACLMR